MLKNWRWRSVIQIFIKKDYEATTIFMISDQISYETVRDNYLDIVRKIWKD